jgi:hypothetical protein
MPGRTDLRAGRTVRTVPRWDGSLRPKTSAELLGWSPRRSGYVLADGTPLTVYVKFSPEGAAVSDLGALPLLRRLRPPGALRGPDDLPAERGADRSGALDVHVPPGGDVGEAVDRLGRVCAQVSRTASESASRSG